MHPCVVWFKRDLRVADHAPLAAAHALAPAQPLRGIYIVEPGLWAQPDAAAQHWLFVQECLTSLGAQLRALGGELLVVQGDAVTVLADLHAQQPFAQLLAHEETGNGFTYARDLAVARWCRTAKVAFREWPQMGVVRRLKDRDDWHRSWEQFMRSRTWPTPPALNDADVPIHAIWAQPGRAGFARRAPARSPARGPSRSPEGVGRLSE